MFDLALPMCFIQTKVVVWVESLSWILSCIFLHHALHPYPQVDFPTKRTKKFYPNVAFPTKRTKKFYVAFPTKRTKKFYTNVSNVVFPTQRTKKFCVVFPTKRPRSSIQMWFFPLKGPTIRIQTEGPTIGICCRDVETDLGLSEIGIGSSVGICCSAFLFVFHLRVFSSC